MVFGRLFVQNFESIIMVDVCRISISQRMDYLVEKMRCEKRKLTTANLGKKIIQRNWMTCCAMAMAINRNFLSTLEWMGRIWDIGHGTERGGQ